MATKKTSPATSSAKVPEPWEEALDAFWEAIVRRFPQARYGDLSPLQTLHLEEAAEAAVNEWIRNNVPVLCKTCRSEIVHGKNEGLYGDECEFCEQTRYETQPKLIALAEEATAYVENIRESSGEDNGENEMLARWKNVIAEANGKAA